MHRIMAEWSLDKLAVLARQAMGAFLNRLLDLLIDRGR